jgi:hypothetical protein
MKEEVEIPIKYIILIMVIFITSIIGAVFYFTRNYLSHSSELKSLESKEINGRIVALKDENRGSFYIEIETIQETHRMHSLPIAWEIEKYNIQVGDSVSKEAGSRTMIFYKLKDGIYKECFKYEM